MPALSLDSLPADVAAALERFASEERPGMALEDVAAEMLRDWLTSHGHLEAEAVPPEELNASNDT
jgi:hypothetical protein